MTHFQTIFIRNLRFLRGKKGISQQKLSRIIDISPNYLNAIENGKNFPSPEVIQAMSDALEVLPYQLFLEEPVERDPAAQDKPGMKEILIQDLVHIKQRFNNEIDELIRKYDTLEGQPCVGDG
jgi:transcriptional regulator with XRE-family HTH domain